MLFFRFIALKIANIFYFSVVGHLRDVDYYYDQWSNCSTTELESTNAPSKRARAMARIQQNLIAAQELGDEKLQVVTQLQEMIDQKTRQLDADFKNLEYADKDDPALMDNSPKDMHPSSPSSYVPSSTNAQRSDEGSVAGSSGTSSSLNNERNTGNHSISGGNTNTSGSHGADRNSKRSRRARETASRSGNNTNTFSNMSKTSQIDLASDSNNSNSNQSNKNAGTSSQSLNTGGSSNSNRKQGGNNGGGNNNNKKRKRKSARSHNGGNGKSSIVFVDF